MCFSCGVFVSYVYYMFTKLATRERQTLQHARTTCTGVLLLLLLRPKRVEKRDARCNVTDACVWGTRRFDCSDGWTGTGILCARWRWLDSVTLGAFAGCICFRTYVYTERRFLVYALITVSRIAIGHHNLCVDTTKQGLFSLFSLFVC